MMEADKELEFIAIWPAADWELGWAILD